MDRRTEAATARLQENAPQRSLLDSLGAKVWVLDAETTEVTFVSGPLISLLGLPVDTSFPFPLERCVYPGDCANVRAACREVATTGTARSVELRVVGDDGRVSWLVGELNGVRDGATVRSVSAVLVDVTETRGNTVPPARTGGSFGNLVDTVDGIVWEANTQFQFTFVSRRAERLLGYPASNWTEDPTFWVNHLHPDDRERCVEFCKTQTALGQPHQFEYRMIAADGRIVWLSDYVSVVTEGGRVAGLRGVIVDITEQKQLQGELERTISLLRATLDSTADGLLVVDRERRIAASNPRFAGMWRIPEDVLATRDDMRVLDFLRDRVEAPGAFLERVHWLYAHPEEESSDVIRLADGRIYERYSRPQRLGGVVIGRVWSFRDVTERKRAEAERDRLLIEEKAARDAAERALALLDTLLMSAPVGLAFLDRELRYVRVNHTLAAMHGLRPEDEIGRSPMDVVPEVARHVMPILRRVLETGEPVINLEFSGELPVTPGRGSWLASYYPVRTTSGEVLGVGAIVVDVTEQKRAGEVQAQLYREAQEAIRVRDDFLAIASHELKTPLTPIAVYLQMLDRKLSRREAVDASSVKKALRQLDRLTGLINDLLDVSRIQAGRLTLRREPMSLRELVRELVAGYGPVSPIHRVELDEPAEDILVDGDRARLAQVIQNLLENAVKYSPDGGLIRVRLGWREGGVLLSVSDPGIGIPQDQQSMLFERFFRARNAPISRYGGLGLGLYIARDTVERHGGRMWVESAVGQGSTFYIVLPHLPHPTGTPPESA